MTNNSTSPEPGSTVHNTPPNSEPTTPVTTVVSNQTSPPSRFSRVRNRKFGISSVIAVALAGIITGGVCVGVADDLGHEHHQRQNHSFNHSKRPNFGKQDGGQENNLTRSQGVPPRGKISDGNTQSQQSRKSLSSGNGNEQLPPLTGGQTDNPGQPGNLEQPLTTQPNNSSSPLLVTPQNNQNRRHQNKDFTNTAPTPDSQLTTQG